MTGPFTASSVIGDMEFLLGESLSNDEVKSIHNYAFEEFKALEYADDLFFVIGNYSGDKETRLKRVRDRLSRAEESKAIILKEIDENKDIWENFYIKFRVFLQRSDYVIGVFEDNDGGHELEVGEVPLSDTYILKRDYYEASIDSDLEHDRYDGMLGTLFNCLDRRGQLKHWTTKRGLINKTDEFLLKLSESSGAENSIKTGVNIKKLELELPEELVDLFTIRAVDQVGADQEQIRYFLAQRMSDYLGLITEYRDKDPRKFRCETIVTLADESNKGYREIIEYCTDNIPTSPKSTAVGDTFTTDEFQIGEEEITTAFRQYKNSNLSFDRVKQDLKHAMALGVSDPYHVNKGMHRKYEIKVIRRLENLVTSVSDAPQSSFDPDGFPLDNK